MSRTVTEHIFENTAGRRDGDVYVTEDLEFYKIKVLKIPLNFQTVLSITILLILIVLGTIYLFKILSTRYCRCKLCTAVYQMGENLAEGGFSSVFMATKTRTGEKFVLKKIAMKDFTDIDDLQFEAKMLIPLQHMNIVTYEDDFIHFENSKIRQSYSYIIVMEYCNGGDLTDKINMAREKNEPFTENQVMEYFCQL